MTPADREQLLGFLLGALDDSEMEAVRRELERRPDWQAEAEKLKAELVPLTEVVDEEPPSDLAVRTCALVGVHAERERIMSAASRLAEGMRSIGSPRNRTSLADSIVAAGICVAVALLFFPAIYNSRYFARRNACGYNLQQVSYGLASYCELVGGGFFPCVPAVGNRAFAGIYAPVLLEGGYLMHPRVLICPSSSLAGRAESFQVPSLSEIDSAPVMELIRIWQTAGGSYGYSLGIVADGKYSGPRNRGRAQFALAGDAPRLNLTAVSGNHGGQGQNLLFEDGAVRFVVDLTESLYQDDPFHNRLGIVEAGIGEDDAVIAPSFASPFPRAFASPAIRSTPW